ncbi:MULTISPECIES: hypothetical protein [Thalassotalea]|uniref:hypothetical protein n=1 Tax=Thalassotalea TaxID=1518149 RepID=UPI0009453019|nr:MULTISPECIES: hypothetical protein [Thalassotalea]MDO6425449.1 hypothetical protein [Thalassotalea sp. 1_MG-2023]OKY26672.1 hypothetical protein BI291_01380 [Thalassotalea sp. PP2-459]
MNIDSAFNSGLQGFQKATETANQAASDIARAVGYNPEEPTLGQQENDNMMNQNTGSGELADLNKSIVEMRVAEHQAKASANVIQTADENLGTLLDVSV